MPPQLEMNTLTRTPSPLEMDTSAGSHIDTTIQTQTGLLNWTKPHDIMPKLELTFVEFWSHWWWELLTWTIGTVAILAVYVILSCVKNKPVDAWQSVISLNAIISVLSQLAQSSLLVSVASSIGQQKWAWFREKRRKLTDLKDFDDASRGPEGSLRFLFKHPTSLLVSLGAITTLLMLAFQPFTQQAVQTPIRNQTTSEPAWVERNTLYSLYSNYSWGDFGPNSCGIYMPNDDCRGSMSPPMRSAITAGFSDRDVKISSIPGNCSTTQCVWEPYNSLAFCSSVEDVTSSLQQSVSGGGSTIPAPRYFKEPGHVGEVPTLFIYHDATLWFSVLAPGSGLKSTVTGEDLPPGFLFDVYAVFSSNLTKNEPFPLIAVRGRVSFCLRRLKTVMFNSITRTELLEPKQPLDLRLSSLSADFGPPFEDGQTLCAQIPGDATQYCTTNATINNIRNFAGDGRFNGSASLRAAHGGDDYMYSEFAQSWVADLYGHSRIANISGFETRMENIALTMTNQIRTRENQTRLRGTATKSEQFFRVQFGWLAFPLSIWALCTLLLAATIVQTERSTSPIWKSSPLVLLDCINGQTDSLKAIQKSYASQYRQLEQVTGITRTWKLEN